MEDIFEFLKSHYQWVVIGFGLLEIIGSLLKWGWILEPSGKMKHSFLYSAIVDTWGEKGVIGIHIFFGTLLILCGILFLMLDK